MNDNSSLDAVHPLEPLVTSGFLEVGDGHHIYHEQCGAVEGVPVIFLHGGPGGGCSPRHRDLFDLTRFRVTLFDQRGCGRSLPRGEVQANTSDALIADIEQLRQHLGIDRWLVFGGSWGAGLALAYAAAHRTVCLGLVLRGVFLGRASDLDWFFQQARQFLPDAWAALAAQAPESARDDLMHWLTSDLLASDTHAALARVTDAALARVTDAALARDTDAALARDTDAALARDTDAALARDTDVALARAIAWEAWESSVSQRLNAPPRAGSVVGADAAVLLDKYRVQSHYLTHGCFWGDSALLARAQTLGSIPTAILHGRLDWVCLPQAAWDLHHSLPGSRLQWLETCGHSPFEPAMQQALMQAMTHFADHGNFAGWGQSFAAQVPA